jgi:hypothetical protein
MTASRSPAPMPPPASSTSSASSAHRRRLQGVGRDLANHVAALRALSEAMPPPSAPRSRFRSCMPPASPIAATAVHVRERGPGRHGRHDPRLPCRPPPHRQAAAGPRSERSAPVSAPATALTASSWARMRLCLHNVATGRELVLDHVIEPAPGTPKTVVVVGGGPGGLEAARVSALRGHRVVLIRGIGRAGRPGPACRPGHLAARASRHCPLARRRDGAARRRCQAQHPGNRQRRRSLRHRMWS